MLRPVQPYVEYILNQDYITEFLCINKDQPKLQCNGNCHLVKQLEKQQDNEPLKSLRIALENYPIGFVSIFKINNTVLKYLEPSIQHNFTYNKLYTFQFLPSNFQPPDLV